MAKIRHFDRNLREEKLSFQPNQPGGKFREEKLSFQPNQPGGKFLWVTKEFFAEKNSLKSDFFFLLHIAMF